MSRSFNHTYRMTPERIEVLERARKQFGISKSEYGWMPTTIDIALNFTSVYAPKVLAEVHNLTPEELRQKFEVKKTRKRGPTARVWNEPTTKPD